MLWYKSWMETRVKLFAALGFVCAFLLLIHASPATPPPGVSPLTPIAVVAITIAMLSYTWLAGAGIATQPGFQASKGLHGSTLFTLSMPVSRLRLLAVRASLGWLEMTGIISIFCAALWLTEPHIKVAVTAVEMSEYAGTLIACASSLYFLSVLLGTFLDDLWRIWGGIISFGALYLLTTGLRMPAALDLLRAMNQGSPLIAHTIPWETIAVSLGIGAVLFFAAFKVVQVREY